MTRVVTLEVVCREHGLEQHVVKQWIERDWLRPDPSGDGDFGFHEIDLARMRLLVQLHALAVGDAGMPVVLSLLDQLYDARRSMARLRAAVATAPDTVRRSLADALSLPDGE